VTRNMRRITVNQSRANVPENTACSCTHCADQRNLKVVKRTTQIIIDTPSAHIHNFTTPLDPA